MHFSIGQEILGSLTAKNLCPSALPAYTMGYTNGGIRGVIDNFGGSRTLMITVTVQLTSATLVDERLLMTPMAQFSVTCT